MTKTCENPIFVVVDDERSSADNLANWAGDAAFEPVKCHSANEAFAAIDRHAKEGSLAGLVTDLKLGAEHDGWRVICHAFGLSKSVRLALYTAYSSEPVQEVFRSRVADAPFVVFARGDDDELLKQWLNETRAVWNQRFSLTLKDATTKRLYEEIAPIYARSDLPILIVGESGTGKESLAAKVHETSRPRNPFLAINCGVLEPSLAFCELFGYTAGSFTDARFHKLGLLLEASGYQPGPASVQRGPETRTFIEWLSETNRDLQEQGGMLTSRAAEQNAGTLFLDKIATLPPNAMAGVLRILETADVRPLGHHGPPIRCHCRIISATNEIDVLKKATGEKSKAAEKDPRVEFRRDLYYRLSGAVLKLPPLRERDPADIEHFVEHSVWSAMNVPRMPVDKAAVAYIVALYKGGGRDRVSRQYQFGNFRPLRHLMRRAAMIAQYKSATSITLEHVTIAVEHGELRVEDDIGGSQDCQIRTVFHKVLANQGIHLKEDFSLPDLKAMTSSHQHEIGFAFLMCALNPNYTIGQIEETLTKKTRGSWIGKGKTLTKEGL